MRKTPLLPFSLSAFLLLFLVQTAGAGSPITITDLTHRTVQVPADPQRIICLGPGALRLIVYLERQDRVVGVEDMEKRYPGGRPYWLAHPELAELPSIGPGGAAAINKEPDLEKILRVTPQLIFVTYMDADVADRVQTKLNIPVVVLSYGEFAMFDDIVYKSLRLAGTILNAGVRAEAVIDGFETARKDLLQRVSDVDPAHKPRVYVGGIGFKAVQGLESTNSKFTPFEWLRADNVVKTLTDRGQVFVDRETLLKLDPDVIFIDGGGISLIMQDYEKRPQYYKGLRAFREERVYILLPFNWYVTNVETVVADTYAVGKILYPDRFADVDLRQKTEEIYQVTVGKPVYEQMKKDYGEIGRVADFVE